MANIIGLYKHNGKGLYKPISSFSKLAHGIINDHHLIQLDSWLQAVAAEAAGHQRSPETLRTYTSVITAWKSYLVQHHGSPCTGLLIKGWLLELGAAGRSPATLNKNLSALRSCYQWMALIGHLPSDITTGLDFARLDHDGALPPFEVEHLQKMVKAVHLFPVLAAMPSTHRDLVRRRNEALVRILFATGSRCISMHGMDLDDLQRLPDGIILRFRGKGRAKKSSFAQIPTTAAAALTSYLQAREVLGLGQEPLWIAMWPTPGGRLSIRSMRKVITDAAEAIGLRPRNNDGNLQWPRLYGPHAIRRASSVQAVDAQGLEAGQVLLGHASVDQTRRAYASAKKFQILKKLSESLDF